jgi:hypothetical protein
MWHDMKIMDVIGGPKITISDMMVWRCLKEFASTSSSVHCMQSDFSQPFTIILAIHSNHSFKSLDPFCGTNRDKQAGIEKLPKIQYDP